MLEIVLLMNLDFSSWYLVITLSLFPSKLKLAPTEIVIFIMIRQSSEGVSQYC